MNATPNSYDNPIFPDIFFDHEKIYKSNPKTNTYTQVGNYIGVKALKTNVETKEVNAILEFAHLAGGRIEEIEVPLNKALMVSHLETLNRYGMDVNTLNKNDVLKQIRNGINNIQESFFHTDMGFLHSEDGVTFKHFHLLGNGIGMKSTYEGIYDIKPKGSLEDWLQMFEKEVKGHIPLELAVVFGLTAPLVGLMGDKLNVHSQLIHIVGNSSMGKTTALQLAVSLFGSPKISPESLILNYNATQNSLVKKLSGNMGVPMAIDEASMVPNKDWTDFLYIITNGEDKERLTKELKLVERSSFRTVVLSSGEYSIVSKAANNVGIYGRVLEYSGIEWTRDSVNSNAIKSICAANYGHIGPKFVSELMALGQESLISVYKKWYKKIQPLLRNTQIRDRLAHTLSIYMLAAHIAKKKLALDLNLNGILNFLVENENKKVTNFDIAITAYEYIKEMFSKHPHRFTVAIEGEKDKKYVDSTECWGYVEKTSPKNPSESKVSQIGIAETQLQELLEKENKFQSKDVVIQAWLEKDWLIKEPDRNSKRVKITQNGRTKCYVLNILKIENELYGDDSK